MSDLLSIADFDSDEFLDRAAGLWIHCENLARRTHAFAEETAKRIAARKFNIYRGLAELGEALLRVQEARPRGFDAWMRTHESQLGFSQRTADRCKDRAANVRRVGLEQAYALENAARTERPRPFLEMRLSLSAPPDQLTAEDARRLVERYRPFVDEVFPKLEERAAAAD